jgi:hypothetical protein
MIRAIKHINYCILRSSASGKWGGGIQTGPVCDSLALHVTKENALTPFHARSILLRALGRIVEAFSIHVRVHLQYPKL